MQAEAIYDQGRDAVVSVLLEMSAHIARLQTEVERLTVRAVAQDERIAVLERQLGRSSRNSSQPPSVDPPSTPPRPSKNRSPRKSGGQPGHKGKGRPLLPTWSVDEIVEHWPTDCACGHQFCAADRVAVGEPARHQVEELPAIAVYVTEHQCQRVCCPACGKRQTGRLPDGVAASAFGPRLEAAVVTLSVRNRISRRDVVELSEQLFSARISTGSVDTILTRSAAALQAPCADLLARVRESPSLNMDETGWRLRGKQRALWGMFSERHAVFYVAPNRHEDQARKLLAASSAIVTSDRWWAYQHLPVKRRQSCWAHLKRDFTAQAEGIGCQREFGAHGLRLCEQLFKAWDSFQKSGDRSALTRRVGAIRREFKPILKRYAGKSPRYKYCRGLARNLLKVWPALWTFADHAGVQPTNNHAERALRGAVIYRKLSLGSQSEDGEQRIARLLSAHTTCRLQGRSLHAYLIDVLTAPAPTGNPHLC